MMEGLGGRMVKWLVGMRWRMVELKMVEWLGDWLIE